MRGIENRWSARDRWLRPTIPNASAADCVIRRRRRYSHLLAAPIENPSAPRDRALLIRRTLIIPIAFEFDDAAFRDN